MTDQLHEHSPDDSIARRHETSDANFKNLMVTGIALLGVMVAGLVISFIAFRVFTEQSENPGAHPGTFAAPESMTPQQIPQLQPSPRDTLLMIRRSEDSVLTSYAWVNKDSGIVRVPIEQAMKLAVEHGLPAREGSGQ